MYNRLDLADFDVPKLPPLKSGRRRSSTKPLGVVSYMSLSVAKSVSVSNSGSVGPLDHSTIASGAAAASPLSKFPLGTTPTKPPVPTSPSANPVATLPSPTAAVHGQPAQSAPNYLAFSTSTDENRGRGGSNLLMASVSLTPNSPGAAPGIRRKSLAPDGSSMMTPVPSNLFIVDKPPKLMKMATGDHYYVPISVTALRLEMTYEPIDGSSTPTVELGASLMAANGKRLANVSNISKATRDRCLQHLADEWVPPPNLQGEAVLVSLAASAATDAAFVFLSISSVAGRSLSDVETITIRAVDVSFYPGNPELFVFEFSPARQKSTLAVALVFAKERQAPKAPVPPAPRDGSSARANASASSSIPAPPPPPVAAAAPALWTAKTLSYHTFQFKNQKAAQQEVERLAKQLADGWLPVAKGVFQSGGDPSRIVGDRMLRIAQKAQAGGGSGGAGGVTPEGSDLNTSWRHGTTTTANSDEEAERVRARRDSVDTMTPVDQAQEDFEALFQMKSNRNMGQGRPRVVRRHRCVYSVGKGYAAPQGKQHNSDSDDDGKDGGGGGGGGGGGEDSDDEEDLFRQVFQNFASRRVIRYDHHCYNIGTDKQALLQFYLEHRDQLDRAIDTTAAPRAPLVVECVLTDHDEADDMNMEPPLLSLDDRNSQTVQHRRVSTGDSASGGLLDWNGRPGVDPLSSVTEYPEGGFVLYNEASLAAAAAAGGDPAAGEPHGGAADGERLTSRSPSLHKAGTDETKGASSPSDQAPSLRAPEKSMVRGRFGPLKPAPPLDMQVLREHQEQLRREEAERAAREDAAQRQRQPGDGRSVGGSSSAGGGGGSQPRRSIGSAGLPPPSSTGPITFRSRNIASARTTSKFQRGTTAAVAAVARTVVSARAHRKRPQQNMFSGQLMQWIDAYMKKEQRTISPGRGSVAASPQPLTVAPPRAPTSTVFNIPPPLLYNSAVLHSTAAPPSSSHDPVLSSELSPSAPAAGSSGSKPSSAVGGRRRTSQQIVFQEPSDTPPVERATTPSPQE